MVAEVLPKAYIIEEHLMLKGLSHIYSSRIGKKC